MAFTEINEGNRENEKWNKVLQDVAKFSAPVQYKTEIPHGKNKIKLLIDMDPGGGFEGGYEFTTLIAPLPIQFTSISAEIKGREDFRFALHDQGVFDRVGKFLNIEEDLDLGFPEFDKNIIVQTNNGKKLKAIFKDAKSRECFQSLKDFTLQITEEEESKGKYKLELMIDRAITDGAELDRIFYAFSKILDGIEEQSEG